jgi:hypothetical protein
MTHAHLPIMQRTPPPLSDFDWESILVDGRLHLFPYARVPRRDRLAEGALSRPLRTTDQIP